MKRLLLLALFSVSGAVGAQDNALCSKANELGQKEGAFHPPLGARVIGEGRTHFFSGPAAQCERKDFLVKDDFVVVYVPYKDWLYVDYINSKTNTETEGWLPAGSLKIGGTMGMSN